MFLLLVPSCAICIALCLMLPLNFGFCDHLISVMEYTAVLEYSAVMVSLKPVSVQ